jgi:hypothetical protein
MIYHEEEKRDALLPDEKLHAAETFNQGPGTADPPLTGDRLLPNSNEQRTCTDYSEEAIPERDPAYQLPVGTRNETQTVEYVTPAERLALARCLEQLGMNTATAAMVASL